MKEYESLQQIKQKSLTHKHKSSCCKCCRCGFTNLTWWDIRQNYLINDKQLKLIKSKMLYLWMCVCVFLFKLKWTCSKSLENEISFCESYSEELKFELFKQQQTNEWIEMKLNQIKWNAKVANDNNNNRHYKNK